MRAVKPLDLNDREHRLFLFDLALVNKQHLLNDHDSDIVVIISGYEQRLAMGALHAFIAMQDEKEIGCVWIEQDHYGIGRVRGAFFPEYRNAYNALFFLKWIVDYGFMGLGLRKLDSEMALYSKKDRENAAAERIYKRVGFKKRAILPEALMIDGQPKDTILLDYLRKDYHGI